ncbi:MAG: hypothetical protein Q9160_000198 [Pyrenula sp. 1 TL-2023]
MADALCGPSNPLQNFQKATSVDRTLQQDRLRSHLPSHAGQGFRSPDPRAGSLDAEFAAFEAGQPFDQTISPPLPNAQLFTPQHLQNHVHQQNAGLVSWAADFQRLQLTSPGLSQSPVPQAQFRNEAPMHRSTPAAGWHNEFLKHQQAGGAAGKTTSGSMTQNMQQTNTIAGVSTFSPPMGHEHYHSQFLNPGTQYGQIQQHLPDQTQAETLDEAAFEAAFAEVASADLRATSELQQLNPTTTRTSDSTAFQSASKPGPQTTTIFPKIGSDLIPPNEQHLTPNTTENTQSQQDTQHEADADADSLARTAGELLHSVKDDSSEKFQQSNFLALMRRLRDREVVVRGEDIVENALAPPLPMENGDGDGDSNKLYNNEPPEPLGSGTAPTPAEEMQPLYDSGQLQQASALHPGGPSYPSPPPPPAPGRTEEHFLDTFPLAAGAGAGAGAGASQAGDLR